MLRKPCMFIAKIIYKDVPHVLFKVKDFKKNEGMGCTYDNLRPRQPVVAKDVVTEVHFTVNSGHMQIARDTSRVLDIPKTTVLKLLCCVLRMFPYRYQCVQMLQLGDSQLRIDFAIKFLIRYDAHNDWPLTMDGRGTF